MLIDLEKLKAATAAFMDLLRTTEQANADYSFVEVDEGTARDFIISKLGALQINARLAQTARDLGYEPQAYTRIIQKMIRERRMPENFLDPSYDHGGYEPKPAPILKVV